MDRPFRLSLLAAVAFAAAVVPTLSWLEFSSGGENLLVATLVEMRADEDASWLVPTLNGQPRVRKPPLPAWASAAATPALLFSDLSTAPVGDHRDRAYDRLAYALRLPAVLMSMAIILLIYEIGRTLRDPMLGVVAAAVAASSLILLRQGRSITSDVHLALWVTAANLALVKVLAGGAAWRWLPAAGAAIGLAVLSKGPVALVQTVVPAVLCLPFINHRPRGLARPAAVALGVGAAVAVPWFAYVLARTPDAWGVWWAEVTRSGATNLKRDSIFTYLSVFPLLAPWTVFLIAGLAVGWWSDRRRPGGVWPVVALAAPLVVMSFVKDKNERYLLPMLAPAAVAAAQGVIALLRGEGLTDLGRKTISALHWTLVLAMCAGVPAAGAAAQVLPDRQAWWGWGFAVGAGVALVLAWWACALAAQRRAARMIPATMLIMFLVHGVFLYGYRDSPPGRSEMKPIADAIAVDRPRSEVWYYDPSRPPKPLPQDLQIYLNRVVRVANEEKDLPAPAAGRVLVMLRREHAPPPAVPGWQEIASRPAGKRSWHALAGE